MKLIIDIDDEDFEIMKHNIAVDNPLCPISQKEMVTKIVNGTPLDKLRSELYDYITHSPYIKSFMDCCRLRDDVARIINKC